MPKIQALTLSCHEDSRTGVAAARAAAMPVIYLNAAGEKIDGAETGCHRDEISL